METVTDTSTASQPKRDAAPEAAPRTRESLSVQLREHFIALAGHQGWTRRQALQFFADFRSQPGGAETAAP